ncbi:CDGSH iron-sulfur domain-containing protein 3, mitochondrial, partial [Orchesella cincta]
MSSPFAFTFARGSYAKMKMLLLQNRSISSSFSVSQQAGGTVKGQIASKAPTRVQCEGGKTYSWCSCGLSAKQPFCDSSHKRSALGLKPVRFTEPEKKEVFLC